MGFAYDASPVDLQAIIAGSAVAGILGLALIIAVVYLIRRKQENKKVSSAAQTNPVPVMTISSVRNRPCF